MPDHQELLNQLEEIKSKTLLIEISKDRGNLSLLQRYVDSRRLEKDRDARGNFNDYLQTKIAKGELQLYKENGSLVVKEKNAQPSSLEAYPYQNGELVVANICNVQIGLDPEHPSSEYDEENIDIADGDFSGSTFSSVYFYPGWKQEWQVDKNEYRIDTQTQSSLQNVVLRDCLFDKVTFKNVDLSKVDFRGTKLKNCSFYGYERNSRLLDHLYLDYYDPQFVHKLGIFTIKQEASLKWYSEHEQIENKFKKELNQKVQTLESEQAKNKSFWDKAANKFVGIFWETEENRKFKEKIKHETQEIEKQKQIALHAHEQKLLINLKERVQSDPCYIPMDTKVVNSKKVLLKATKEDLQSYVNACKHSESVIPLNNFILEQHKEKSNGNPLGGSQEKLTYHANFSDENLVIENMDFSGLDLSGVIFAKVTFKNCKFDHANLSASCFEGVKFDGDNSFKDATLNDANLIGARAINGAKVDFENVKMIRARMMKSEFQGSNFNGAIAYAADFTHANIDKATLDKINLNYGDLEHANLRAVTARLQAQFKNANLTHAILDRGKFDRANFKNAVMRYTHAVHTVFDGANMPNVNAENGNFSYAHLNKIKGKNINFMDTKLIYASLHDSDLENVKFNKNTLLLGVDLKDAIGAEGLRELLREQEKIQKRFLGRSRYAICQNNEDGSNDRYTCQKLGAAVLSTVLAGGSAYSFAGIFAGLSAGALAGYISQTGLERIKESYFKERGYIDNILGDKLAELGAIACAAGVNSLDKAVITLPLAVALCTGISILSPGANMAWLVGGGAALYTGANLYTGQQEGNRFKYLISKGLTWLGGAATFVGLSSMGNWFNQVSNMIYYGAIYGAVSGAYKAYQRLFNEENITPEQIYCESRDQLEQVKGKIQGTGQIWSNTREFVLQKFYEWKRTLIIGLAALLAILATPLLGELIGVAIATNVLIGLALVTATLAIGYLFFYDSLFFSNLKTKLINLTTDKPDNEKHFDIEQEQDTKDKNPGKNNSLEIQNSSEKGNSLNVIQLPKTSNLPVQETKQNISFTEGNLIFNNENTQSAGLNKEL
ncbi:pentapeptide repeat-containing protein [Fastidiosibacter lacustris]|uniref:pentapeptide repeat-containing protein n=1 Tax=Fastidiosibacter lacustris TaxID=2056695 RepID=UPI000E34B51E|nr:pentapeptide repeat-containing protein [Fastidiosibacter lacustris]